MDRNAWKVMYRNRRLHGVNERRTLVHHAAFGGVLDGGLRRWQDRLTMWQDRAVSEACDWPDTRPVYCVSVTMRYVKSGGRFSLVDAWGRAVRRGAAAVLAQTDALTYRPHVNRQVTS